MVAKKMNIKPMLCDKLRIEEVDSLNENDYFSQVKIDGNRAIFVIDFTSGVFKILNRDGKDKKDVFKEFNLDKLRDYIDADNCILDGEIYSDKFGFDYVQERSHLSNQFSIRMLSETKPLCFNIFDIINLNGIDLTNYPIEQRMARLSEVVIDSSLIKRIDYNIGNIKNEFKRALDNGFEGLILKRIGSPYEFKRSSSWLKLKPKLDMTCVVLGWNEKKKGSYGSMKTDKCDVGLLNFTNKKEYDELVSNVGLGSFKVEIEYQTTTKDGKPRFPIFKRWVV